jgi:ELWxxDGT repeat protein
MAQSVMLNGKVYYIANNPSYGNELYSTDGTSSGTNLVKDLYSGSTGYANYLAVSHGKLFFYAMQSSGTSAGTYEPFISDGTALGTTLLKDVNPSGSSSPRNFTEGPGALTFFTATDETTTAYSNGSTPNAGEELWVSDGTQANTHKWAIWIQLLRAVSDSVQWKNVFQRQ